VTRRALAAIVNARLRTERRTILFASATAAIVGFIQPHGIATITDPLSADVATRSVWLAGPMFFCSALGVALALAQGPGRNTYLDIAERSAPLFGRELARAKAIAPLIAATISALVYWFAQFLSGFAAPPTFFVLALACVYATTLVALNATLRQGGPRALYLALCAATALGAYALAVYADPKQTQRGDAIGVATELLFCAIVGFIALRQYGEALARWSPLDR